MIVLVSGATGFIGSALVPALERAGHRVRRLTRSARGAADVAWDPAAGVLDPARLGGIDAVVHLAGASIGARRWGAGEKRRILESRVAGTRLLAATLAALERPPRVLLSASAVGWYGDRGDEPLDEASGPGRGFLAGVVRSWEEATSAAAARGIRVARLRMGLVLGAGGGVLARMLPPFRLGLGGPLGSGRQWMSWIALDDLIAVVLHALRDDGPDGPLNAVSPHPVTNREFARTLGGALGRPARVPAPAWALRLLLGGERAHELLLSSQRVQPRRLLAAGFRFGLPDLEPALRLALRLRPPAS